MSKSSARYWILIVRPPSAMTTPPSCPTLLANTRSLLSRVLNRLRNLDVDRTQRRHDHSLHPSPPPAVPATKPSPDHRPRVRSTTMGYRDAKFRLLEEGGRTIEWHVSFQLKPREHRASTSARTGAGAGWDYCYERGFCQLSAEQYTICTCFVGWVDTGGDCESQARSEMTLYYIKCYYDELGYRLATFLSVVYGLGYRMYYILK